MPAPYYVDDGRQTYTRATRAEAERLARLLTMKNAANGSPDKAHIFRPHDVGEYCECGDCDPHAYADQPEDQDPYANLSAHDLLDAEHERRYAASYDQFGHVEQEPDWEAIAQAMSDKE